MTGTSLASKYHAKTAPNAKMTNPAKFALIRLAEFDMQRTHADSRENCRCYIAAWREGSSSMSANCPG
jgi:hypothetical protein